MILKKSKESLQGRAKVSKGGQSATNMYAYKYTLARGAIVATFDLSAANLDQFEKDHWLSCNLNVICLRFAEKAFEETLWRSSSPLGGRSILYIALYAQMSQAQMDWLASAR